MRKWLGVCALALVAACTGDTAPTSTTALAAATTTAAPTTSAPPVTTTSAAPVTTTTTVVLDLDRPHWTYGALGDAHVHGAPNACGGCTSYPILVAEAIMTELAIPVLLVDGTQPQPLTTGRLLDQVREDDWGEAAADVRTDRSPRDLIAASDVITIGVGHDNLPWYQDEDPCLLVYDQACVDTVVEPLAEDLDAILAEIDAIRGDQPTVVMVTTLWNDVIAGPGHTAWMYHRLVVAQGDSGVRHILQEVNDRICGIAGDHDAVCLDVATLFNGRHGSQPLGEGYLAEPYPALNQAGQDAIATAIMGQGFDDLPPPS
ncbi:MAG: hypothetical protein H0V96_12725 [Acidimicrobiia bacterium]|nr:hypothetical protein [Acidimicrobiia bacterium]